MEVSIVPVGDTAIQVLFQQSVSGSLHHQIRETEQMIMGSHIQGVLEIVPGLQTLTVYYNPLLIRYVELYNTLFEICQKDHMEDKILPKEIIYIPTCYGGEFGEDLEHVAAIHQLSVEDVVGIHSKQDYLVYMIGFLPGFPYLKGLSDDIVTPRLAIPRLHVPKGSVGIGGNQTGIYPLESPGGWNLIGRTPLPLFDPLRKESFLLKSGDFIRFKPISKEDFAEIECQIKEGTYQVERDVIPVENN